MFCGKCGRQVEEEARFCPGCGHPTQGNQEKTYNQSTVYSENTLCRSEQVQKSKIVAGLLQIFLGAFGVGRFYLGYTGIGIAQVVTFWVGGFFTCGLAMVGVFIWTLIDGILILCDQVPNDAKGVPLKE